VGEKGTTKHDEQESAPTATVPRDEIQIQIQNSDSSEQGKEKIHPNISTKNQPEKGSMSMDKLRKKENKSTYLVATEQRRRTCENMFHGCFISSTDYKPCHCQATD